MSLAQQVPETVEGLTVIQRRLYAELRTHGPIHSADLMEPVLRRRFGSDNAIATHVYRMRPKLEAHGLVIKRTRREGYSLVVVPGAGWQERGQQNAHCIAWVQDRHALGAYKPLGREFHEAGVVAS